MTVELEELQAEIRRLRAGQVRAVLTASDPHFRQLALLGVVSAASLVWEEQLDRVDRFSLPLQASGTRVSERARATTTARLFLEQLASDYRRTASPTLDLFLAEELRTSDEGARSLAAAGLTSTHSVAPLAIGQHLTLYPRTRDSTLASMVAQWLAPYRHEDLDFDAASRKAFGEVLGPMVRRALPGTYADHTLPAWTEHVGRIWGEEFLAEGAAILDDPALLNTPQIEGSVLITSRRGSADVTETVSKVIGFAQVFRPVIDVRVGVAGDKPKIDVVLAGDQLERTEFTQFMGSVADIDADVMLYPNSLPAEPQRVDVARARVQDLYDFAPKDRWTEDESTAVNQLLEKLGHADLSLRELADIETEIVDLEQKAADSLANPEEPDC